MTPEHTKITDIKQLSDNEKLIDYKSYTDKLSLHEQKTEKTIKVSRNTVLSEVIKCLEVISNKECKSVTIEIRADDMYEPKLIIKTHTTHREYFGK